MIPWPATMPIAIHFAAAIMAVLATLHLVYTLHDLLIRPRYFRPMDRSLLEPMQATTTALAPQGHNYWRALLGFHLSHSIGILLFAGVIELAMDPHLAWLRPALIALGGVYAIIGWTCWFWIPATGATMATGMLIIGWWIMP